MIEMTARMLLYIAIIGGLGLAMLGLAHYLLEGKPTQRKLLLDLPMDARKKY